MNVALLAEYGPALLEGFVTTLLLSAIVLAIATPVGALLALMRESGQPILAAAATVYVSVFRLVPALLVLFFTFYAMPQFGIRFSPMGAAVLGLSIIGSAYLSEDIRGGLSAIDAGQYRAAKALGLGWGHTMRRIILPQAIPIILPPYITRAIIIVKSTSLASIVAVADLTGQAVRAASITYQPFPFLITAGLLYLAISGLLAVFQAWAEHRVSHERRVALRTRQAGAT
ncbi:amino acid ABC transporter permease [uncultured Alsobacter sp.]|uniref:amino acid ABC transporter permease n=1 Tax=uncultured Alsobacter sp. TaxID=1748258 RepID=UPI0025EC44C2|nr:amino acid ABC transporter permease [uncultured Alsobacter sp.]